MVANERGVQKNKLDQIAERKGTTQAEALQKLVEEDLETLEEGDKKFRALEELTEKRLKRTKRTAPT